MNCAFSASKCFARGSDSQKNKNKHKHKHNKTLAQGQHNNNNKKNKTKENTHTHTREKKKKKKTKFNYSHLSGKEFQEIVMFLQNLPTADWDHEKLDVIIAQAYLWHSMFQDTHGHLRK